MYAMKCISYVEIFLRTGQTEIKQVPCLIKKKPIQLSSYVG